MGDALTPDERANLWFDTPTPEPSGRDDLRRIRRIVIRDPDPNERSDMWLWNPLAQEYIRRISLAWWREHAPYNQRAASGFEGPEEFASTVSKRAIEDEPWEDWNPHLGPWQPYLYRNTRDACAVAWADFSGSRAPGSKRRTRMIAAIWRADRELRMVLGRQPTPEEVAEAVSEPNWNVRPQYVRDVILASRHTQTDSLDAAQGQIDEEEAARVMKRANHALAQDDPSFEEFERAHQVEAYLAQLGEEDQLIVQLRFGRGLKAREIAEQLNLTTSQAETRIRVVTTRLKIIAAES